VALHWHSLSTAAAAHPSCPQIIQLNALRPQCEQFCALLRDGLRAQLSSMKKLKGFTAGCYSEVLLAEAAEADGEKPDATPTGEEPPKLDEKAAAADAAPQDDATRPEGVDEKDKKAAELARQVAGVTEGEVKPEDEVPPAPAYHAGLGARFRYPGDPRK